CRQSGGRTAGCPGSASKNWLAMTMRGSPSGPSATLACKCKGALQSRSACSALLHWHARFADVPEGDPLIVIANEFFDALPVHQAVRTPDGWHERMVGIGEDEKLMLALHPDPILNFSAMPLASVGTAPVGAIYEWRSDALVTELAERLVRDGGAALIIDYGHCESACGETLQAVGRHGFAPLLERPGEVDLSAHVDFAALGRS